LYVVALLWKNRKRNVYLISGRRLQQNWKSEGGERMPQIVKGGKYVYGWSKVSEKGEIVIPDEAVREYHLKDTVILLPGSKRSGGFGLTTIELLKDSSLFTAIDATPLGNFSLTEGEILDVNGRPWCWVRLYKNRITVPLETLTVYGIHPGDSVLSVRGSRVAIGFVVRGPIVEEAQTHPEIVLLE
jgi:bifunctional DNA-binding transcriptional regulator/antitoxin component of YhaV-PrlF toxin-antitoxin module